MDKKTMISFHLPEFSQAAKIQIIAQVSAWISTMLPLIPLLPYLTEQSLYIHLRFHRLVETHLVNDLFLDRLIARIIRDAEGLIIVGYILSKIDRIGSHSEMEMQDTLSLHVLYLFPQHIDVFFDCDSRHFYDGAGH